MNNSHCPISTETQKRIIPATISPGQARPVDGLLTQNHKMPPSSRANKELGFRFKSQRVPIAQEHIDTHSQQGLSSTLGILSCCKSQVRACVSGCGDPSQPTCPAYKYGQIIPSDTLNIFDEGSIQPAATGSTDWRKRVTVEQHAHPKKNWMALAQHLLQSDLHQKSLACPHWSHASLQGANKECAPLTFPSSRRPLPNALRSKI